MRGSIVLQSNGSLSDAVMHRLARERGFPTPGFLELVARVQRDRGLRMPLFEVACRGHMLTERQIDWLRRAAASLPPAAQPPALLGAPTLIERPEPSPEPEDPEIAEILSAPTEISDVPLGELAREAPTLVGPPGVKPSPFARPSPPERSRGRSAPPPAIAGGPPAPPPPASARASSSGRAARGSPRASSSGARRTASRGATPARARPAPVRLQPPTEALTPAAPPPAPRKPAATAPVSVPAARAPRGPTSTALPPVPPARAPRAARVPAKTDRRGLPPARAPGEFDRGPAASGTPGSRRLRHRRVSARHPRASASVSLPRAGLWGALALACFLLAASSSLLFAWVGGGDDTDGRIAELGAAAGVPLTPEDRALLREVLDDPRLLRREALRGAGLSIGPGAERFDVYIVGSRRELASARAVLPEHFARHPLIARRPPLFNLWLVELPPERLRDGPRELLAALGRSFPGEQDRTVIRLGQRPERPDAGVISWPGAPEDLPGVLLRALRGPLLECDCEDGSYRIQSKGCTICLREVAARIEEVLDPARSK